MASSEDRERGIVAQLIADGELVQNRGASPASGSASTAHEQLQKLIENMLGAGIYEPALAEAGNLAMSRGGNSGPLDQARAGDNIRSAISQAQERMNPIRPMQTRAYGSSGPKSGGFGGGMPRVENSDLTRRLEEERQTKRRRSDMLFEAALQNKMKDRDRNFLKSLLGSLGGGKERSASEQIFNVAGAPQRVKLQSERDIPISELLSAVGRFM